MKLRYEIKNLVKTYESGFTNEKLRAMVKFELQVGSEYFSRTYCLNKLFNSYSEVVKYLKHDIVMSFGRMLGEDILKMYKYNEEKYQELEDLFYNEYVEVIKKNRIN